MMDVWGGAPRSLAPPASSHTSLAPTPLRAPPHSSSVRHRMSASAPLRRMPNFPSGAAVRSLRLQILLPRHSLRSRTARSAVFSPSGRFPPPPCRTISHTHGRLQPPRQQVRSLGLTPPPARRAYHSASRAPAAASATSAPPPTPFLKKNLA